MKIDRFEQLYEEHAEALLGFLVYRTGDRVLAEEVLADTFERVLRSRGRFNPHRGSARSWIYSIALNRLRDIHRRHAAEQRALQRTAAGVEAFASEADWIEEREDLSVALRTLDDLEREAIALRYGADLSVPEVAAVLGVKASTVEGRIYRGLRKLREELAAAPTTGVLGSER